MKIQSARDKGKVLEDYIVDRLRITGLDKRAYRQKGSGSGICKGDVWNDLNLAIEAKNTKNFSITEFLAQAERQTLDVQEPVVVWHPPRKPLGSNIVVITWEFFEKLMLKYKEPTVTHPDREFKYKLQRLVQYTKDLISELET